MRTVRTAKWLLECDVERTHAAYAAIPLGGPEQCGCAYCRNFAVARGRVYPRQIANFLEQFGIKVDREAEVCEMPGSKPGLHLYSGWFHVIGRIQGSGRGWARIGDSTDGFPFNVTFAEKGDLAHQPLHGQPLVQLDFNVEVPWLLQEPDPPL